MPSGHRFPMPCRKSQSDPAMCNLHSSLIRKSKSYNSHSPSSRYGYFSAVRQAGANASGLSERRTSMRDFVQTFMNWGLNLPLLAAWTLAALLSIQPSGLFVRLVRGFAYSRCCKPSGLPNLEYSDSAWAGMIGFAERPLYVLSIMKPQLISVLPVPRSQNRRASW
jgi:hypothetical protein